ncbi:cell division protein ZapE [Vibrio sp. S4M6]|uniref:cell division protein ZapE n=1 Tax=Vibrio sinus TaxID=2946865 RepID=UPI00202AA3F2|nr:cell division protein ZapE [Vibrio sinus]MCL9781492.1 cell division protein ZapE [Vibrio sinus]
MTPKRKYQQDIEQLGFKEDEAQRRAVEALDKLYIDLIDYLNAPIENKGKAWQKWFKKTDNSVQTPRGLYLWGGVGRGKTYLMDSFYESLPTNNKMRMHFHRFMLRVHDELRELGDISDPLESVADTFKEEAEIICFDEFFVSDITDAMILGTLFQALFKRGVILVATSNIPPHELYRNGLQRARFLPAIEEIENNCLVLNVDSGVDYRLRTLTKAEIYHYPLDQAAINNLEHCFDKLSGEDKHIENSIEINRRQIDVIQESDGILYASFEQLCQTARSQNDYIELSRLYHTVLLSDVKAMGSSLEDAARRFIALVDEFYERNVKLIISAEVPMNELYTNGLLEFEFKRCVSRLTEMQSCEYLAKEHLS